MALYLAQIGMYVAGAALVILVVNENSPHQELVVARTALAGSATAFIAGAVIGREPMFVMMLVAVAVLIGWILRIRKRV